MECPVCTSAMVQRDFGGMNVDVCENGCKGLWFDWFELSHLDETNEGVGQALQDALHAPRVNDASRGTIDCPKCHVPMHRHLFASDKQVNVDECYGCAGFFLDSGELVEIRDHHMTPEEEEAYGQKLLNDSPVFQAAEKNLEKESARADAVAHLTRFVRLSYYIRGK